MPLLRSTSITSTLSAVGFVLATLPFAAHADRNPNSDGSCPSNYTKGTGPAGKARCLSPSDKKHAAKQQESKSKKSGSKSRKS